MSKPNEPRPVGEMRRSRWLAVLAGVAVVGIAGTLLQLPRGATAGVAERTPSQVPPVSVRKAPGTYQLRCWQYGRLLFDEGPVTLPPDARQAATLVALDRNGAALIVTDTGGATCLARPSAAAPNLALPH